MVSRRWTSMHVNYSVSHSGSTLPRAVSERLPVAYIVDDDGRMKLPTQRHTYIVAAARQTFMSDAVTSLHCLCRSDTTGYT